MKKIAVFFILLFIFLIGTQGICADRILKMSTTTSTVASGLLDVLLPEFTKLTGIQVKVIAKGTGAAIRDGQDGNVDIIFVHAKERGEKFVKQGCGTKRFAVMHNDFVILGPENDPAKISGAKDAVKAFEKIAKAKNLFVSRGDDSGTHTKEQAVWKIGKTGLEKKSVTISKKGKKKDIEYVAPKGGWYLSIGQGMGKALTFAEEKQAYTMSDRGTYIKYKFGRKQGYDLNILREGDDILQNPYGIIPVNPKKHPHAQYAYAMQFVRWITSEKGQFLIKKYKLEGRQPFYPDAVK